MEVGDGPGHRDRVGDGDGAMDGGRYELGMGAGAGGGGRYELGMGAGLVVISAD